MGRGQGSDGRGKGRGVPPHHRHKIQPGYRCARMIRQSAPNGAYRELSVYGQESCPQPETDHREDETTIPRHPEGGSRESHKTCRCWPSPSSRTQDATRNRKSARRKMILRPSLGGSGMFEMTKRKCCKTAQGSYHRRGKPKEPHTDLPVPCGGDQGVALLIWGRRW